MAGLAYGTSDHAIFCPGLAYGIQLDADALVTTGHTGLGDDVPRAVLPLNHGPAEVTLRAAHFGGSDVPHVRVQYRTETMTRVSVVCPVRREGSSLHVDLAPLFDAVKVMKKPVLVYIAVDYAYFEIILARREEVRQYQGLVKSSGSCLYAGAPCTLYARDNDNTVLEMSNPAMDVLACNAGHGTPSCAVLSCDIEDIYVMIKCSRPSPYETDLRLYAHLCDDIQVAVPTGSTRSISLNGLFEGHRDLGVDMTPVCDEVKRTGVPRLVTVTRSVPEQPHLFASFQFYVARPVPFIVID